MAEMDYVDITPREMGGRVGLKGVVFQEREWDHIINNPGRLTREGVEESIRIWSKSSNKHVLIKYRTMLAQCKELGKSGLTKDGCIIYSRDKEGTPNWIESKPFKNPVEEAKPKNKS